MKLPAIHAFKPHQQAVFDLVALMELAVSQAFRGQEPELRAMLRSMRRRGPVHLVVTDKPERVVRSWTVSSLP